MSRIQVFNHHSLPFDSSSQADEAVPDFLKLCVMTKRLGFDTILIDVTQDKNWFRVELAPRYFFQDWYNKTGKRGTNRDILRAFLAIATRTPLFTSEDLYERLALFEVKEATSQIEYSTLRAAAWYQSPVSSFPTRAPWNQNPVIVTVTVLDEDGEHRNDQGIVNWHSSSVIKKMEGALRKERDRAIRTGSEIWASRSLLFHLLEFCGECACQIQHGLSEQTILDQVRESLRFINLFVEKWRSGEIIQYSHDALRSVGLPHKVSGESAPVRNDPRLRASREFWLPSGKKAFFESHVKLSSGFRIHFYPEPETRCVYIGYIGRHLRTARHQ